MALTRNQIPVKERAKQIARELDAQITKKEIRVNFNCGHATANEVYRIKQWESISKSEVWAIGYTKRSKRNTKKQHLVCLAWHGFNSLLAASRAIYDPSYDDYCCS